MELNDDKNEHDDTVRHLATSYANHHHATGPVQRSANKLVYNIGRPVFVYIVLTFFSRMDYRKRCLEICGMEIFKRFSVPRPRNSGDGVGLYSNFANSDYAAARRRTVRQTFKTDASNSYFERKESIEIIELLEQQRRDNPLLESRVDMEAVKMAKSPSSIKELISINLVGPESDNNSQSSKGL